MSEKSMTPVLAMMAVAATVAMANNCIRTLPQEDGQGNQILACDEAQPPEPSYDWCESTQTLSEGLTKAVGGFPYGRQSMQLAIKYCQWSWLVDTNDDGYCDSKVYTSVPVGSSEATGAACPGSIGIH